MTAKRAISLIGRTACMDDKQWCQDALALSKVTVNGQRVGYCVAADESSGVAVCVDGVNGAESIDRPDVGYRMKQVVGVVVIGP